MSRHTNTVPVTFRLTASIVEAVDAIVTNEHRARPGSAASRASILRESVHTFVRDYQLRTHTADHPKAASDVLGSPRVRTRA